MLCKIGLHDWGHNCTCSKCGKINKKHHNWDGCICTKCKQQRDEEHNWNGCLCKRCGKVRDQMHDLEGCFCNICKREIHNWVLIEERIEMIKEGGGIINSNSGAFITVKEIKISNWKCERCGEKKSNKEIISEEKIEILR